MTPETRATLCALDLQRYATALMWMGVCAAVTGTTAMLVSLPDPGDGLWTLGVKVGIAFASLMTLLLIVSCTLFFAASRILQSLIPEPWPRVPVWADRDS